MKEIGLVDYTGAIFGSTFLYVLPGADYTPGTRYKVLMQRLPLGEARIVAVTQVPLSKLSETVSRLFMGKCAHDVRKIFNLEYKTREDDIISICAWEWIKIDNDALKALMEMRFDAMKGLNKHERNLKLALV
jgi:gentisate 1,2-dioxygenase